MTKSFLAAFSLLLILIAPSLAAQEKSTGEVKIGILSWRGPLGFKKSWGGTSKYLSEEIGRPVVILPLEFKDVLPAVKNGEVDFFTADPSMFMSAKIQYGASEILTMKLSTADSVGAVLFTRTDNQDVTNLTDLNGKKFGALQRWSFGGWQMAEKEFRNTGIDPYPFLHTLRFFDRPDAVVKAVLSGRVDAGTVPASILERLAKTGKIQMEDIKILKKKDYPDFPYACSTELYPGFPLAKTTAVDQTLANELADALKALQPGNKLLRAARMKGWVDPLDYTDIEIVQSQLKGGGYTGRRTH
ncbi:phosphate/phosphite/phosphonate ABC transporter substrate-binding protein [Desulfobulbus sp. N2]|nr:phosphate/phosphite/phosphonate ABC transporter substrate-binding protein [Desulfobulbus sp. US4]MCW5205121.1 phosphate/phosphite/phosphonate ABC transporter substrate-binding protein [Desulfobulbus sp. N2]WLE96444.1 MAG: PhnD/SsuA/transferrin family substrate-binding protein [Candidatus Electrothrix communis]